MDKSVDAVHTQGRSWGQILELQSMLANATEEFAKLNYLESCDQLLSDGMSTIDRMAMRSGEKAAVVYEDLCAIGDALMSVVNGLKHKGISSHCDAITLPTLSMCNLCWRTGIRTIRDRFYCSTHLPNADNPHYKAARLLRTWERVTQPGSHKELVFFHRLRDIKSKVASGLSSNGLEMEALYRALKGDHVVLEEIPKHHLSLPKKFEPLPRTLDYLDLKGANLDDPQVCLLALDPLVQGHEFDHKHVHELMCHDMRHIVVIARIAEAWLDTAMTMASSRGRGRPVNFLDLVIRHGM